MEIQIDEVMKKYAEEIKKKTTERLKNYDWLEKMRLNCRAYIKVNGTKSTTVDEVVDALKVEALNSFPKNLVEQLLDESEAIVEKTALYYLEEKQAADYDGPVEVDEPNLDHSSPINNCDDTGKTTNDDIPKSLVVNQVVDNNCHTEDL